MPRLFLSAFRSAFDADALGLTVKATVPAPATAWLPLPKTIFAGRHLPPSLTLPFLHLPELAANTPNFPFWNVSSQLKVPGLLTDALNVIAPVFGLIVPRALKTLLGPGGVMIGWGVNGVNVTTAGRPATVTECVIVRVWLVLSVTV